MCALFIQTYIEWILFDPQFGWENEFCPISSHYVCFENVNPSHLNLKSFQQTKKLIWFGGDRTLDWHSTFYKISFFVFLILGRTFFLSSRKLVMHFVTTLALGSQPKQGLAKVRTKRWSPKGTFHAPRSVGECEGMNLHTLKWVPTLGVGAPMNFLIFRKQLQGSKPIGLKISLYH